MKTQHIDSQLREHYEIERRLATRLRNATKHERRDLYRTSYEDLFRLIPHHTQLQKKYSQSDRTQRTLRWIRLIKRFLTRDSSFLEIGAGDCALVFEVSRLVKRAYAVEVSPTIASTETTPENFRLLLSDGCSIPVAEGEVHVAYSNQLMEHLHPEDAAEQLRNVYKSLAPKGVYVCVTPNRLTGPHDISKYFDDVATGLHLKEYTITELDRLFREVGFEKTMIFVGLRGRFIRAPLVLALALERVLERLPIRLRSKVARMKPVRHLIDTPVAARKGTSSLRH